MERRARILWSVALGFMLVLVGGCRPKHHFDHELRCAGGGRLKKGGSEVQVYRMGATLGCHGEAEPCALVVRVERQGDEWVTTSRQGYWHPAPLLRWHDYRWTSPTTHALTQSEVAVFERYLDHAEFWRAASTVPYAGTDIPMGGDTCVVEAYVDGKRHFVERETNSHAEELFLACDVLAKLVGVDRELVSER